MACHHPFTAPKDEDIVKLLSDKANCYSKAYDIVINGYEAGGREAEGNLYYLTNNATSDWWWTITLAQFDVYEGVGKDLVYNVSIDGGIAPEGIDFNSTYRPAITLKAGIELATTSGVGTVNSPYVIK